MNTVAFGRVPVAFRSRSFQNAFINILIYLGLALPKRMYRYCWNTDDYSLGGWAFQSTSTPNEAVETLGQPLPTQTDPKILFAGEATDNRFFGNMLGARYA